MTTLIGPPDPNTDLLAHVEINSDGKRGAHIHQWARGRRGLAFEYYRHRFHNFWQARISFGLSRPGTEVYVNGKRV